MTTHRPLLALPLACSLACACAAPSATSSSPSSPSHAPFDVKAALARETTATLHAYPVEALDGAFSALVLSSERPKVRSELDDDGQTYAHVSLPIGSGAPIECYVKPTRLDPADTVRRVFAEAKDKAEMFDYALDVSEAAGTPLFRVDLKYLMGPAGDKKLGHAKVVVAPDDNVSVFCVHDEPGYEATFDRVTRALLKDARRVTKRDPPRYHALHVVKMGGKPIGLDEVEVFRGKDGQSVTTEFASGLFVHGSQWGTFDRAEVAVVDTTGELVSHESMVVENGALSTKLDLKRVHGKEYAYEGKREGKPVQGTFKSKAALTTELSRAPRLAALVSGGRHGELRFYGYDAGRNATAASEVLVQRADGRRVTFSQGKSLTVCEVDEQGLCKTWEETDADGTVLGERIYTSGDASAAASKEQP